MTIRQRELYGDNDKLKEIEKDWTIRSQRDIVAFRNRERDVQRNKDVEVLLTPEELPNIQNISTLSETSLKSFLSNVIKTANGRLNHLGMYRDVYLKDDDMGLRKETITGIPATSFDDINDLSTLLASHWCRNKNIQKIDCDTKNHRLTLYQGQLDLEKVQTETKEVEEDLETQIQAAEEDPKKKKKTEEPAKAKRKVVEHKIRPAVRLCYFRTR